MNQETFDINHRLIEKCREGDMKAQFMLYKNYSKAMYNIAIRITGNGMDAEDILQESFVTAFGRLGELGSTASFTSWLKRIVINNSISFVRKRRLIFDDLTFQEPEADDDPGPEIDIDPALVHEAIKALPDGSRTILVLYALEGYRHREIAEMMEISESTSKSQYRRALTLLRERLLKKTVNEKY
ncbi:MAG TPA: sigma-70 family RNA polymerase sigma factor [Bacteroidales bacterium]|nr:sigma-70 family RNA polymerase sigma factor [Bacteroidales bacterium]